MYAPYRLLLGLLLCSVLLGGFLVPRGAGQELSRDEKMERDRQRITAQGVWIYNDLAAARARAAEENKPLIVVLRCVPCEECVKLDDELIDQDPRIGPLLERFVGVRLVSTNGLDLSIFQFDTDQSFAVFFLHADGTVYGRFGTRSHRTEWAEDVSIAGLEQAMQGALRLHADYPANRSLLAGKQGTPLEAQSPELYPSLREKYTSRLKSGGELVKSCIHCHQIGDAQKEFYWNDPQPFPLRVLFPYPHPKSIGLVLDPDRRATVSAVLADSPAAQLGLLPGDDLQTLEDQPLLSIADVQWVLHHAPDDGGTLHVSWVRDGEPMSGELTLGNLWRVKDDLSWRASSWGLRRMVTGGLVLESLPQQRRKELGIPDQAMALRVQYVGQYGPHATAKNRGFIADDLIVSWDGLTNLLRETDLFAHAITHHRPGDEITVKVRRGTELLTLSLPIQP